MIFACLLTNYVCGACSETVSNPDVIFSRCDVCHYAESTSSPTCLYLEGVECRMSVLMWQSLDCMHIYHCLILNLSSKQKCNRHCEGAIRLTKKHSINFFENEL